MMGIVVEVVLAVRPRIPVTTHSCTAHVSDGQAAAKAILQAHNKCDALFAILVPSRKFVYLELRHKVTVVKASYHQAQPIFVSCRMLINALINPQPEAATDMQSLAVLRCANTSAKLSLLCPSSNTSVAEVLCEKRNSNPILPAHLEKG